MQVNHTERWLRLTVGAVVLLFAGIIYAWAILKTPFATEFGWNAGQLSLNYTITIVAFCTGGFIAGLLTSHTSPRTRLLVAAAMLFAGFFVTSRLSGDKISHLYLSYGVLAGCGVGFAYTTVIGMTSAWFPDKKGFCSGVLLMSFGLTSLVIGGLADSLMKAPQVGWRNTFLILAVAEAAVLIVASFIIRAPRENILPLEMKASQRSESVDVSTDKAAEATATKANSFKAALASQTNTEAAVCDSSTNAFSSQSLSSPPDLTVSEMIRQSSFWITFAYLVLLASVGSAAIALAADILRELGVSSPTATIGIISLFNGLGRLCSGTLFDKLGIRKTQFITSAVAITAPLTVIAAVITGSLMIGLAGLSLCYFSYGFAPTSSSVFTSDFYGMKHFSVNFSVMNLLLVPAPFAATMAGTLFTQTGSFVVSFAILTGCSLVGLVLNMSIRKV